LPLLPADTLYAIYLHYFLLIRLRRLFTAIFAAAFAIEADARYLFAADATCRLAADAAPIIAAAAAIDAYL